MTAEMLARCAEQVSSGLGFESEDPPGLAGCGGLSPVGVDEREGLARNLWGRLECQGETSEPALTPSESSQGAPSCRPANVTKSYENLPKPFTVVFTFSS